MKIRKLLIANRGEIARRVIRTAHRLGVETVAVYSDVDRAALHVREASQAVALRGAASADTYLRIDKLMDAARASGADAVHPGYGFLSENAEFAQEVEDHGLTWIGPGADAIRTLGNKSRAKQLAHARGVPCLPGYEGEDQSDTALLAAAADLGVPLMVKAAAGGGGRGMRLVTDAAQLPAALQSARSEAQSAFGCGDLLLERALPRPRHVEIQVLADMHGRCLHLGERDCSVQRRHQKLIEETPSPAVDAQLREHIGQAAVELARAAGYVGAGTVEFLLDGHGRFFMLEMNTRLQVEHAVTEMATGLDLVEWQLRIACGERLPYRQDHLKLQGHAIEVRLYAEDEHFTPQTGSVQVFHPPALGDGRNGNARLRFDHAIFEGLQVTPHYDAMLGKLVAHGATRAQAIDRLASALDRLQLLGVPTNRRLLAACLRHPQFAAGEATIPFLAEHGDTLRAQLAAEEFVASQEAALAVLLPNGPSAALPSPFVRPLRVRHHGQLLDLSVREAEALVPSHVRRAKIGPGRWHVQHGSIDLVVEDASFDPPAGADAAEAGDELRVPFNGKVIGVHAQAGGHVRKGETLVVVESMKLEHAIAAPRDGTVQVVHVQRGQQVAAAQLLLTLETAP